MCRKPQHSPRSGASSARDASNTTSDTPRKATVKSTSGRQPTPIVAIRPKPPHSARRRFKEGALVRSMRPNNSQKPAAANHSGLASRSDHVSR